MDSNPMNDVNLDPRERARAMRTRLMGGAAGRPFGPPGIGPPQMDPSLANPYQSPPGSGSNDGALPTTYDAGWQKFTNLTSAQVEAFQSFPQWLQFYAKQKAWEMEQKGFSPAGIDPVFIAAVRAVADGFVAQVAPSITTTTTTVPVGPAPLTPSPAPSTPAVTMAMIDAALAAVTPSTVST